MGFTRVFGTEVPDEALCLLWRLEERGVRIHIDDENMLIMKPVSRITEADRTLIRRFKAHLLLLVRGCDDVVRKEAETGGWMPQCREPS
jgi:hypothetical protein